MTSQIRLVQSPLDRLPVKADQRLKRPKPAPYEGRINLLAIRIMPATAKRHAYHATNSDQGNGPERSSGDTGLIRCYRDPGVAEHHVQIGCPEGVLVAFDESVDLYDFIDPQLAIARFTTSSPVDAAHISFNPGIGIAPEIREWEKFRLDGKKTSLFDRMFYMQVFMRNHIENMAQPSGVPPDGGFRTFDPDEPA